MRRGPLSSLCNVASCAGVNCGGEGLIIIRAMQWPTRFSMQQGRVDTVVVTAKGVRACPIKSTNTYTPTHPLDRLLWR